MGDQLAMLILSRYARYLLFGIGTVYFLLGLVPSPYDDSDHSDIPHRMKAALPKKKKAPLTPKERLHLQTIEQEMITVGVQHYATTVSMNKENESSVLHGIDAYRASEYPVLSLSDGPSLVQVRFLMGSDLTTSSKFLVDGIERSSYLKLVSVEQYDRWRFTSYVINQLDALHPVIYIADVESMSMDCHVLHALVKHNYLQYNETVPKALVVMDYSGSPERLHCPSLETLIPRTSIRLTRRNIVERRHWDRHQQWIEVGDLAPNDGILLSGGPILHSPHVLRSEFVSLLQETLAGITNQEDKNKKIVHRKRSKDLIHSWRPDDYSHYSFFRRQVSEIVASLDRVYSRSREIHAVVNVSGKVERLEQNMIDAKYVDRLLSAKVVVVAQRDEWEGHYRLWEALASGALVLTDDTLALPEGLVNGTSIVVYDSAESLREHLLHYLSNKNDKQRVRIAQQGFDIAMGRHQSWHRLEEILFGQALTQVDKPYEAPPSKSPRTLLKGDDRIYFEDMFDFD